jgi:hypothetical protein
MATIRAFRESDIDPITRLHQQVFPPDTGPAPAAVYQAYFRDTFLVGPRPGSGFESLVCEESDGALSGFLGVVPVPLALGERTVWATVCTQFCVDPGRRGMNGLKLIRHHFAGRQDLSISDGANTTTMRLWRWAGGEPILSCSLYFLRPLQPAQFATSLVARRLSPAGRLLPAAKLFDRALARLPQSHFRLAAPSTRGEPLDAAAMAEAMPRVAAQRSLRPVYEESSLAWYLRRAEAAATVRGALVRDERGKLLGWYLYSMGRDQAEVLQIAAPPDAAVPVIEHLLHDAWQAGVLVLNGRLDPGLAQACSDRYFLFSRRGPWTVVHARDPAILAAFHRGDAMFTRLEGEWCARFVPPAG